MPLLAAFLGTLFSGLFEYFAKTLTVNLALAAAFITANLAAYAAVKSVLYGLGVLSSHFMPDAIVALFNIVLPSDIAAILTSVWVGDAVMSGWGWWQQRAPVLFALGKA